MMERRSLAFSDLHVCQPKNS